MILHGMHGLHADSVQNGWGSVKYCKKDYKDYKKRLQKKTPKKDYKKRLQKKDYKKDYKKKDYKKRLQKKRLKKRLQREIPVPEFPEFPE